MPGYLSLRRCRVQPPRFWHAISMHAQPQIQVFWNAKVNIRTIAVQIGGNTSGNRRQGPGRAFLCLPLIVPRDIEAMASLPLECGSFYVATLGYGQKCYFAGQRSTK